MTNKPIILVDLDGTVRATWAWWRQQAQYVLKRHTWPSDWAEEGPNTYWFLEKLKGHVRYDQLVAIWSRPGMFLAPEPYPHAVEIIRALSSSVELFLVTQPYSSPTAASENWQWVEDHFGAGWDARLIQTHDRTLLQANLLIDDKPQVTGVVEFPTWQHVLYDQPYNRRSTKPRIQNWNRIEEILKHV